MIGMIVEVNVSNKTIIFNSLIISFFENVTINIVFIHVTLQDKIVAVNKCKGMGYVNMLVLHQVIFEILEIVVIFLVHAIQQ